MFHDRLMISFACTDAVNGWKCSKKNITLPFNLHSIRWNTTLPWRLRSCSAEFARFHPPVEGMSANCTMYSYLCHPDETLNANYNYIHTLTYIPYSWNSIAYHNLPHPLPNTVLWNSIAYRTLPYPLTRYLTLIVCSSHGTTFIIRLRWTCVGQWRIIVRSTSSTSSIVLADWMIRYCKSLGADPPNFSFVLL